MSDIVNITFEDILHLVEAYSENKKNPILVLTLDNDSDNLAMICDTYIANNFLAQKTLTRSIEETLQKSKKALTNSFQVFTNVLHKDSNSGTLLNEIINLKKLTMFNAYGYGRTGTKYAMFNLIKMLSFQF